MATEEGRRAVLVTLVSDVATSYFLLREFDLQLEIARRTLALNDQTVSFYKDRLSGGVSNRLELDQAVANRSLTAATIPDIERQISILENAISVLAGRPPGAIARGRTLDEQTFPPIVPVGVPAALLERRPDVVDAERLLVAANADIGAAKALFYPTITLTGSVGFVSSDLSDLLKGDSVIWSVGAGLFQPLFNAGRIRATTRPRSPDSIRRSPSTSRRQSTPIARSPTRWSRLRSWPRCASSRRWASRLSATRRSCLANVTTAGSPTTSRF